MKKTKGKKQRGRNVSTKSVYVSTLIVTEGVKTEPEYFRNFATRLSKVVVSGEGKSSCRLVREALSIRGLEDYDRVWVVFDKDENPDFNEAIALAEKSGFNVAWSNESFELWLYLHFQFLESPVQRAQYSVMLEREICKYIKDYKYEKNDASLYHILQDYGDENSAIERAKKLCEKFSDANFANHNPCTTVYKLVEELRNPERLLGAV